MSAAHPRSERGQVLMSVLALVSAVVVIGAAAAYFAGGNSSAVDQARTPRLARSTPTPREDAGPAKMATHEARTQPSKKHTRDSKNQPGKKHTREPPPAIPDVYVEVYNNSPIAGLAAQTAASLQNAGWQVVGTDNWYGSIPQSTVYYPSGLETQARQLAQVLGIARIWPAVSPMSFDRLTVILTSDYTG